MIPNDQKNIATAATQYLTPAVVKYKNLEKSNPF
jgi:hypothetical protein